MPQATLIQNSFNSGELSPLAIARSDTAPYRNGLGKCRNMIVTPVGPAIKRPGSRYVAPIADEDKMSRLIGYSFSNVASYTLEFANQQIRFFTPAGVGGWLLPPTIAFDDQRIDLTLETIGLAEPHYYQDGAGPFQLTSDGTLPAPLAAGTDYYIRLAAASAGAASFGLSLTPGGAAVGLTDKGTLGAGEFHYITPQLQVIQAIDAPYLESELFEIDFVPSGDILYITHQNHAPRQLERRTANGFRLREVFFRDGPWGDINLNLAQTMDPSDPPVALTQSEGHDFPPADVSLSTESPASTITIPNHGYEDREGPLEIRTTGTVPTGLATETAYYVKYTNEHQFQLSSTPGGAAIALTTRGTGVHTLEGRSADAVQMAGDFFDTGSPSTDVGRLFRVRTNIVATNPLWSWGIIRSITDAKNAVTSVFRNMTSATATSVFRMGAFYPGNYPAYCGIHEQRLWFASTPSDPNDLWGSQVGDFAYFAPDEGLEDYDDQDRVVTEASAIRYTLGAGQVDKLAFIAAVRQMIIGTTGAIWPIQSSSNLEPLTQANMSARPSAILGSSLVKPVSVSDEIIYLSASTHKLLAIGYDFERDGYIPTNLSLLADHFTEKRITQLAYAEEPHSIIWGCREDGLLVGVTYERSQRVLGWHGHTVGGPDAKVLSITSVNDDALDYNQLWMVVERTLNGQTRRYIEFLEPPFYTDTELEDAAFLDSSLVPYDGPPTTQVTGLDHLEAETVSALADGIWYENLTVVGGSITLPVAASKIRVGFPFLSYVQILPIEAEGAPGGSIIDRTKRLIESWLRLHRTNYVEVGLDLDNLVEVPLREPEDTFEDPVPLRTQDVSILTDHGSSINQAFYVASDKPVPLDLLGISGRLQWAQR